MKQVTLYCKIGRAESQPLASFDYADEKKAEIGCDAVQQAKVASLLQGGVSLDRVEFQRIYTENGILKAPKFVGQNVAVATNKPLKKGSTK